MATREENLASIERKLPAEIKHLKSKNRPNFDFPFYVKGHLLSVPEAHLIQKNLPIPEKLTDEEEMDLQLNPAIYEEADATGEPVKCDCLDCKVGGPSKHGWNQFCRSWAIRSRVTVPGSEDPKDRQAIRICTGCRHVEDVK